MALQLIADGFAQGATIPKRFTCDGENISPALRWTGQPAESKSFALIMDDPDAPGGTWNHWLVWDIPASDRSIPEGAESGAPAKSGKNDFGELGYDGPCPPRGKPHRYFFRLFALDEPSLGLPAGAKRAALDKALRKHVIAESSYTGRYGRA